MDHQSYTILPFLLLMFIAVAAMPGHVYLVNTGEMGIEHGQPWRSRMDGALRRAGLSLLTRCRALWTRWRGHPLASAVALAAVLLVATWVLPSDAVAGLATVAPISAAQQLKALRQESADISQKTLALNQKITDGTALTEEERADLRKMRERAVVVREALAIAEEENERARAMAAAADAEATASGRRAPADGDSHASAVARENGGLPRVEVGKDLREEEAKQPGYFGRQLQAVLQFAAKGGWYHLSKDEQHVLGSMLDASNRQRILGAATGMNTDIASDGGFLVGRERTTAVLQRVYTQGVLMSRITPMPIGAGSNGMTLPAIDETSRADNSRYGGIVSGWLGQGNTLTSGKPKFREMDMKLRKVGAFVYATNEQLADAIALEAWVNRYLPLELTFRVEDAVLNGLGGNQPQGARLSGGVITVTRNTASRILYEDVSAMWMRMWAPCRLNSVWLIDQSCESQLEQLAIPIGTGGTLAPIYKAAGTVVGSPYAHLYGRPIIPVEYCAALGTSGDIVLVDLGEYTMIDKGGIQSAASIHVAFLTDEEVFRFMYRCDGQLSWNAPLTPKSGGDTLSCIVVLS